MLVVRLAAKERKNRKKVASSARDGQMLCEDGLYKLASCQPIDMFPQTNHVESVARFVRS